MTADEFYDEVWQRMHRGQVLELMDFYRLHRDEMVPLLSRDQYHTLTGHLGPIVQMARHLEMMGWTDEDLRRESDAQTARERAERGPRTGS